jgi:hypothetical protein
MPDGICVFRSSITVKIAYDGYYTEARGIDICHRVTETPSYGMTTQVVIGRIYDQLSGYKRSERIIYFGITSEFQ